MKKKVVWMKVSHDKYELPIIVADSVKELAEKSGTTKNCIMSYISHAKHGRKSWTPFVKVVIEEGEEDEREDQGNC